MTQHEAPTQPGPWQCDGDAYQFRTLPSSASYRLTDVMAGESRFVIKAATDARSAENLGNSVAWAQSIAACHPQTFDVMLPLTHPDKTDGGFRADRAHFQWVEGSKPDEEMLGELVEPVADIVHELGSMSVAWTGSATEWLRKRREGKVAEALSSLPGSPLSDAIVELLSDEHSGETNPGVVHGDLKPDNMLIRPNGRIVLHDAEFGTHAERPHYTVPRMLDAAYFYHILHVQYEQPETAKQFLVALAERFQDDPAWEPEFQAAVAERTLSMYHNFILHPKADPSVDPRRRNPDNYITALESLAQTPIA